MLRWAPSLPFRVGPAASPPLCPCQAELLPAVRSLLGPDNRRARRAAVRRLKSPPARAKAVLVHRHWGTLPVPLAVPARVESLGIRALTLQASQLARGKPQSRRPASASRVAAVHQHPDRPAGDQARFRGAALPVQVLPVPPPRRVLQHPPALLRLHRVDPLAEQLVDPVLAQKPPPQLPPQALPLRLLRLAARLLEPSRFRTLRQLRPRLNLQPRLLLLPLRALVRLWGRPQLQLVRRRPRRCRLLPLRLRRSRRRPQRPARCLHRLFLRRLQWRLCHPAARCLLLRRLLRRLRLRRVCRRPRLRVRRLRFMVRRPVLCLPRTPRRRRRRRCPIRRSSRILIRRCRRPAALRPVGPLVRSLRHYPAVQTR